MARRITGRSSKHGLIVDRAATCYQQGGDDRGIALASYIWTAMSTPKRAFPKSANALPISIRCRPHDLDGKGYATVISTLPERTVGSHGDYQAGFEERRFPRAMRGGYPRCRLFRSIKNFSARAFSAGAIESSGTSDDMEAIRRPDADLRLA